MTGFEINCFLHNEYPIYYFSLCVSHLILISAFGCNVAVLIKHNFQFQFHVLEIVVGNSSTYITIYGMCTQNQRNKMFPVYVFNDRNQLNQKPRERETISVRICAQYTHNWMGTKWIHWCQCQPNKIGKMAIGKREHVSRGHRSYTVTVEPEWYFFRTQHIVIVYRFRFSYLKILFKRLLLHDENCLSSFFFLFSAILSNFVAEQNRAE